MIYSAYFITWILMGALAFLAVINPNAKKQIKRLGVNPSESWFSHWANNEFMEKKLDWFYEKLLKDGLLKKCKADIQLLESYILLFDKEASQILNKKHILSGSGVILVFTAALWSQIIGSLFKVATDENFMETIKFCFTALLILAGVIIFYNYVLYMVSDIRNRKGNKYREIQRNLNDIKMNLEMEYAKDDLSELTTISDLKLGTEAPLRKVN